MLQRSEQPRELSYASPEESRWTRGSAPRRLDLHDIYTFLKANWRIIAAWVIVAVALALAYSFTATRLYTATAELALELAKNPVVQQQRAGGRRQLAGFVTGRKRGRDPAL